MENSHALNGIRHLRQITSGPEGIRAQRPFELPPAPDNDIEGDNLPVPANRLPVPRGNTGEVEERVFDAEIIIDDENEDELPEIEGEVITDTDSDHTDEFDLDEELARQNEEADRIREGLGLTNPNEREAAIRNTAEAETEVLRPHEPKAALYSVLNFDPERHPDGDDPSAAEIHRNSLKQLQEAQQRLVEARLKASARLGVFNNGRRARKIAAELQEATQRYDWALKKVSSEIISDIAGKTINFKSWIAINGQDTYPDTEFRFADLDRMAPEMRAELEQLIADRSEGIMVGDEVNATLAKETSLAGKIRANWNKMLERVGNYNERHPRATRVLGVGVTAVSAAIIPVAGVASAASFIVRGAAKQRLADVANETSQSELYDNSGAKTIRRELRSLQKQLRKEQQTLDNASFFPDINTDEVHANIERIEAEIASKNSELGAEIANRDKSAIRRVDSRIQGSWNSNSVDKMGLYTDRANKLADSAKGLRRKAAIGAVVGAASFGIGAGLGEIIEHTGVLDGAVDRVNDLLGNSNTNAAANMDVSQPDIMPEHVDTVDAGGVESIDTPDISAESTTGLGAEMQITVPEDSSVWEQISNQVTAAHPELTADQHTLVVDALKDQAEMTYGNLDLVQPGDTFKFSVPDNISSYMS